MLEAMMRKWNLWLLGIDDGLALLWERETKIAQCYDHDKRRGGRSS